MVWEGAMIKKPNSKTSNNRTGGANNEYRGGPGGPGTGFCGPGGGFLTIVAVVASHYCDYHQNHPQDHQNQYQDHQDHPCTRYGPPLNVYLVS